VKIERSSILAQNIRHLRKENLREQTIHNGPVERLRGSFAVQVSGITEMVHTNDGLRVFGGLFLRLKKPMALEEEQIRITKKKYPQNWDNDDANTSQRECIGEMERRV
jgi:hypothetical protein